MSHGTVTVEGVDADAVYANEPETELIKLKLSSHGLAWCDCNAHRFFHNYLRDPESEIKQKKSEIKQAVQSSWKEANTDIAASAFAASVKDIATRKRRSLLNNDTIGDENGNDLTDIPYMMTVSGQDPDPFFVEYPDVSDSLGDLGLESCLPDDCYPSVCHSMNLKGEVLDTDEADVISAVKSAYLEANPGLSGEEIQIQMTYVESGLEDDEGERITRVGFCVSPLTDGVDPTDLIKPSDNQLTGALDDIGREAYDGPLTESSLTDSKEMLWIILAVVLCSVAALVIVLIAILKVFRGRCKKPSDPEETQSEPGVSKYSEDDYTTRGPYQATFYQTESTYSTKMNKSIAGYGSQGSRTKLVR